MINKISHKTGNNMSKKILEKLNEKEKEKKQINKKKKNHKAGNNIWEKKKLKEQQQKSIQTKNLLTSQQGSTKDSGYGEKIKRSGEIKEI